VTDARGPSFLERLLARLQRWADAGWSGTVVFGWGLAQGCIIPGLVDLFFIPLALARPAKAYRLAVVAIMGTVLGSVLLYVAGAEALDLVQGPLSRLLGMSPARFEDTRNTLAKYGGLAILASTMSPLSTKLTSIASGAAGVPFVEFLLFLTAGRSIRAFGIAWLIRNGGAEWMMRALGVPNRSAGEDERQSEGETRREREGG
jgi:membrane protein YqaA with SNARE-associated domain